MIRFINRRFRNLTTLAPYAIIALALILMVMAIFGDESYVRLQALQVELESQRQDNDEMREYLKTLKRDVVGLTNNDRLLEKTVRNDLGMQRDNEITVIFEE